MKLSDDLIKVKKLAGRSPEGQPAILVETYGGLYAIFLKKKQGGFESVAAGPHLAVCCFMAEKKVPGIRWEDGVLMKSEGSDPVDVLRRAVSDRSLGEPTGTKNYIVYDPSSDVAAVMDEASLVESYAAGEVEPTDLVRISDLSSESCMACRHPALGGRR